MGKKGHEITATFVMSRIITVNFISLHRGGENLLL
jgi:hypothetical protein